ncbi:DUF2628 domain-containing protein [methanotrophic endosymbiont of Bathymodiolus puteoserpentis (Logatchev)]|jgi:hypothetical protein|uniref:DUF2628 domain-containing protein n=1 Tax=methanotrophic endosymbiont of Bathymodiolus puteoserpentis (Logatchev) TaxID=343235 RepID=UPI0013C946E1|nr:DUF2628 domain-containing protein [methanotrophic endosymbiont of Bathymodiolus puteoserpentis (Logatchev)]SHE21467.1 hypothetical protein BPUTEOMOX_1023 [methanotrophic endosymbiont of Bathymodiolus puteoserpentis (Logatchev)]
MQQLYEAILGKKNRIYYQTKFYQFDQKGEGMLVSWNWSAFFFSGIWALYRKMYGWFFLFLGLSIISNILEKSGASDLSAIILGIPAVLFAIFSNSLYHKKIVKKITKAKNEIDDEDKLLEFLKYKGGVNTWVILVCNAMLVISIIGIIAAILVPMFAGK